MTVPHGAEDDKRARLPPSLSSRAAAVAASGALLLPASRAGGTTGAAFVAASFVHYLALAAATGAAAAAVAALLPDRRRSPARFAAAGCVALVVLLSVACEAAAPPTAKDALVHHLALPKWWRDAGDLVTVPWHEWSYYQNFVQTAFVVLLGLSERLPAFYSAAHLIVLCGLVASAAGREDPAAARPAVLLAATTPLLVRLASWPMPDLPLATYSAAAVIVLASPVEGRRTLRDGVTAGLLLGAAAACKPNGVPAALLAVAVAAADGCLRGRVREGERRLATLRRAVTAAAVAALVYAPWGVRSYAATGSLSYPLLPSPAGFRPAVPGLPEGPREPHLSPYRTRADRYGESLPAFLAIPVRFFVSGRDGDPRRFDGVLSALTLLCLLPPVGPLRRGRGHLFYWAYAAGYTLLVAYGGPARVRYLAPAAGLYPVVAALTLSRLAPPRVAAAAVLAQAVVGAAYAARLTVLSGSALYAAGLVGRDAYLRRASPAFAAADEANRTGGAAGKTYLLLTPNPYYLFDVPVASAGYHSAGPVTETVRLAHDAAGAAARFRSAGFGYLLADPVLAGVEARRSLDPAALARWEDFSERNLRPVASAGRYVLFEITP